MTTACAPSDAANSIAQCTELAMPVDQLGLLIECGRPHFVMDACASSLRAKSSGSGVLPVTTTTGPMLASMADSIAQ
jgi:hypothetical protein